MTSRGLSRRRLLLTTAGIGLGSTALSRPVAARTPMRQPARTVAVLGGGVAGLTAAHELAERGFHVTVYEHKALGGKARSIPVPGTGTQGRADLPGEHGFRFFPGFYKNLPDTMRRIPFSGNDQGTYDNLVSADTVVFTRSGGRQDIPLPADLGFATLEPDAVLRGVQGYLETALHLPPDESLFFARRLLVYLTSCTPRRFGQWEHTPWWDYVRAEERSEEFRRMLAIGITRNVVATKAEVASTNTIGRMMEAFLFTAMGRGNDGPVDRLLDAPTNEAWIDPWHRHLRELGVGFEIGRHVENLEYREGRIAAAGVRDQRGHRHRVEADWFVCAVPIERAVELWNPSILAAAPRLRAARELSTDWMVGLQFYLPEPTPLAPGHLNHVDSPWALTSISQAQFWKDHEFARDFGDGTVRDCLSAVISRWEEPGILFGKPALKCTRLEVAQEVWAQLKASLNDTGQTRIPEGMPEKWHLDPAITGAPEYRNDEPLLIHPVGTWAKRPTAVTEIGNFFLAADYVRNDIDLATMEGANEAARQAVNGLLDAAGSDQPRCPIHTLYRAPEFEPLKQQDEVNYELGLPNTFDLLP